jgi:hypothetical protein
MPALTIAQQLLRLTPDQREQFHERAAIKEYDGKLPREQAEREAMREVLAQTQSKDSLGYTR